MKKAFALILLSALMLLMISCTPTEGEEEEEVGPHSPIPHSGDLQSDADSSAPVPENQFYMIGKVKAINDKVEIEVIEAEYAEGIYNVIISEITEIYDNGGAEIGLDGIKIGDTVEIIYSGQVMMSYPPQIAAIKVILK